MPDPAGRRPYISGNWKMHKNAAEAREYMAALLPKLPRGDAPEVGVCVPFTSIAATVEASRGSGVRVAAQNMHWAQEGAFTGEVSAPMLLDVGADAVVLG